MSDLSHIQRLRDSKTFQYNMIEGIDQYRYRSVGWGIFSTLPPIPKPTDERSIVVLDVTHDCPIVISTLQTQQDFDRLKLRTRQVANVLFVAVSKKPKWIKIHGPKEGYQLGDGRFLSATVDLLIRIENLEDFWGASIDPIEPLVAEIHGSMQQHLSTILSDRLITIPPAPKRSQYLYETKLRDIKDELNTKLAKLSVTGLKIEQRRIHLYLSDTLQAWVDRQDQKIWGEWGIYDRLFVDAQIQSDDTFTGFLLRSVIMNADRRLLENFYTLPFGEAMQKLHERIAELKNDASTHSSQTIEQLKEKIQIIKEFNLGERSLDVLETQLANELENYRDNMQMHFNQSDEDFFAARFKGAKRP